MNKQDFSRKIVIVVNKNIPEWQVLNTVGHVSAYFGSKMKQPFDTGDFFTTNDQVELPRNSQYPIIVLEAESNQQLHQLGDLCRENKQLKSMFFIKEMVETSDDAELNEIVGRQDEEEIEYLGIGLFGDNKQLDKLTGSYKLWS
jgi:hypothetical protein